MPFSIASICSTDSGVYGSHTKGHSVGPLVHCDNGPNIGWDITITVSAEKSLHMKLSLSLGSNSAATQLKLISAGGTI